MLWITLVLTLVGCGSQPEGPLRSSPIEPTAELGDPAGLGVKWAELEGFVSGPAPRLPEPFGALALGQPEADATAALAALHEARVPAPRVVEIEGHRMHGAVLASNPDVTVTAIVELASGVVTQLDAALPADQALYAFTEAWGPPTMESDPAQGPVAVWRNAETRLRVQLFSGTGGLGIAKFSLEP